jgi:hypothetical protein
MNRNTFWAAVLIGATTMPVLAARDFTAAPQVSPNQKGSLLYWSDVEVKFDENGFLVFDTFIELTNDSNDATYVQLYFVNGDCPLAEVRSGAFPFELLERAHPGWNFVDAQIFLSPNKPTFWSAASGNNGGGDTLQVPPFGNLDADPQPVASPDHLGDGRLDPDNAALGTDNRTVRGFILGWAVEIAGQERTHNNLTGSAMKVDYQHTAAWEYDAFAYKRLVATAGDGALDLNGVEYDASPARLQLDFYTVPTTLSSAPDGISNPAALVLDTDLTVHLAGADFRAVGAGPQTTWVLVDLWNQNEDRFSGTSRCLTCWDQTLLRDYMGVGVINANHFLRANIGTDKGKARLTGNGGVWCPNCHQDNHVGGPTDPFILATEQAILGVAAKILVPPMMAVPEEEDLRGGAAPAVGPFENLMMAGSPLTLQGTDDTARVLWDIVDLGRELENIEMEHINRKRTEMGLTPMPSSKTTRTIGGRQ